MNADRESSSSEHRPANPKPPSKVASGQHVAVGPPWTFITTGTVRAPIDRVWAIVGDFAGLEAWHPRIRSCEADGSTIGSYRSVDLGDRVAVERLDDLDVGRHLIAYSVVEGSPLTVGVSGRIRLEPSAHDTTSVEWVTTVPNRPGSGDLVARLKAYYVSRVDDLRAAVMLRLAAQNDDGRCDR
jgi:uncharacterized protein YndB with AHSA1/START domain